MLEHLKCIREVVLIVEGSANYLVKIVGAGVGVESTCLSSGVLRVLGLGSRWEPLPPIAVRVNKCDLYRKWRKACEDAWLRDPLRPR